MVNINSSMSVFSLNNKQINTQIERDYQGEIKNKA